MNGKHRAVPCAVIALACVLFMPSAKVRAEEQRSRVEQILAAFASDFEQDPYAVESPSFAVRVEDAEPADWTVHVRPAEAEDRVAAVSLERGLPEEPVAFFKTNTATLEKIYANELHGLTAAAGASVDDGVLLKVDAMEGFQPDPEVIGKLFRLYLHFWTRNTPEIIAWGRPELSRVLHGVSGGVFYYQRGFRSIWFHMSKGQHANADDEDKTNPFPSLFIVVDGEMNGRIGGTAVTLRGGEAVFVGPGTSHEFWNDREEPAIGIMLAFGEGA